MYYRPNHYMFLPSSFPSYPAYQMSWQQPYTQPYGQMYFPMMQQGTPSPLMQQGMVSPYPTPYPKPNAVMKPPASGLQSIMSQFKTSDGTFDVNKMMNTMGQMVNAVNQVGNMFKGLSQTFKF